MSAQQSYKLPRGHTFINEKSLPRRTVLKGTSCAAGDFFIKKAFT